jgi:hypothetical protein
MELDSTPEEIQLETLLLSERDMRAKIREIDEQISHLARQREAWRMMIEARRMLTAAPDTTKPPGKVVKLDTHRPPGIKQAILLVMNDEPDREWSAAEIYERLQMRGWTPGARNPRQTMGASLSRMAHRSREIEKVGDATYKLRGRDKAARYGSR